MDRLINAILAGIAEGAIYGLVALGIVLVYKATRVLNFAQAEIGTLCIYVAWLMTSNGVSIFIAAPVALIAAACLGAGTEFVLRPLSHGSRLTVTVATLGIATALGAYQIVAFGPDAHGDLPAIIDGFAFKLGGTHFAAGLVLALFVTAVLGSVLFVFFKKTLFGLGVLAAAQDQTALRLQGLPLNAVSVFTWATGAVLTAIAGIILAPVYGAFAPFFMTTSVFIPALAAALVGGLTSLPGAFVGGIVVGISWNIGKFFLLGVVPGPEYLVLFVVIVAVLLFRPQGLLGSDA